MSFEDFIVADADMHVMEPADLWQRYIAPEYAHAAPIGMTELRRDIRVKLKSQILLRAGPVNPLKERGGAGVGWRSDQEAAYGEAEAKGWSAQAQLDAMEREGVDLTVLFPTRGLFVLGLDSSEQIGPDGLEPEYAAAIARAYNDWLADYRQLAPDRLHGAGMVAPHDIDSAVLETRRVVEEYGFKAIYLAPGCVNHKPWHHRDYDPLWAECERLGIPVCFHGGGRTLLKPDFGLEVFADRLMMWHTFNQPLGVMAAAVSLCAGGVLERFPTLRVGLLEGNCSWAPWLMHRLDEHYEWVGWYEATDLSMKPSEYFRRQCFVSVEVDEETVVHYLDWFGDDNLVFSTDYPHGDSQSPHAVETFEKLPFSEQTQRKVVGDNWSRLYDIPLERHRA